MRFSHFLKYNAVPEWQSHYMDYSALKNLIYTLQTDELTFNGETEENTNIQPTLESSTAGASSPKHLAKRLKNKLFSKNESGRDANQKGGEDEGFQEETIELEELASPKIASNSNGKNFSLKKVKGKFFESRRSSLSSEGKTLFSSYDAFVTSLNEEKLKVDDFYKRMESKFFEKFETLVKDLEKEGICHASSEPLNSTSIINRRPSEPQSVDGGNDHVSNAPSFGPRSDYYSEEDLEDEEEEDFETHDNTALLNYSQFNIKSQKISLLKQSIANLYIDLCQLKSFIELNRIGFSKITKKFDKVLHMNTREELILSGVFFRDTYVFEDETLSRLNDKLTQLNEFYALIKGQPSNIEGCKQELKSFLHDHIVWERSNTWKDMLGLLSHNINGDLGNETSDNNADKLRLELYSYHLPKPIRIKNFSITKLSIPKLFFTWKAFKIAFIITLTGVLLGIKTFNDEAQHRCMALVECVAFLWASEAIPLHTTAFLVPLLVVLFRVLKDSDGNVIGAAAASRVVLSQMWSSTIMILLAGFTLGEALAQYDIAKVLASWLLAAAGTKPRNVLLMSMSVVFFLSMWISNVAAPVLTYSLLSPLLLPLEASSQFGKALVMGVAFSADIGGMASPISSPQNVISMQYLKPYGVGWGQFFAIALPSGILAMLMAWGVMCVSFKFHKTKVEKFVPIRTSFTLKQYFVIFVTLGTILLWCVENEIEGAFGSSGIIAALPIVLFFGTGLLSTKDLNSFPWSIVILAMGGIALGNAVSTSGLLNTIARALQRRIQSDGLFAILCIFGILMLVVGTFVSHTVSAIIIIPLVQEVGDRLDSPKAAPVLIFGCALLASCGMGLASSGFPNVTAISMTDKKGERYLSVGSFIVRGVPTSFLAFLCIITLGYGIMISVLKGPSA
ncbi:hypothetical protein HG535_0A01570 [Zygotorulaspora mrakii]|uniref:SPX domain-containing protein n=1 Tax=Zygotorulaspora mrakii TaxID=42260 RepID=A0A7H9AWR1_ZYGMR|nr:uncharacterized protein HG535_0A01570 [Zygotorulaspora mrakii]QLG70219.1 hypothetical protein HG535_0A01570 [Zygotorulaspora mrakii]